MTHREADSFAQSIIRYVSLYYGRWFWNSRPAASKLSGDCRMQLRHARKQRPALQAGRNLRLDHSAWRRDQMRVNSPSLSASTREA